MPRNEILVGVADSKIMEPITPPATVRVPDAESCWLLTVAVAVITSAPVQPVAAYVVLTMPVVLVTGD